ncbi:ketopantoate reductase family protein [Novosphingobium profundi]|uniref:ketopantoate reductase family protein n=1 Tax=Novosphingobium profundi TaxID=1774954 RepID=UPI001CFE5EC4|nr:2-dehydropantoate 2-reductase [Novosphingobium profundi]
MSRPLRTCIFGGGAVGSLVAARLQSAGKAPTVIARGRRLEQLERQGITFADPALPPIPVTALDAQTAAMEGGWDVVFLALKAQAIAASLEEIRPLIGPATRVVPLVNGVPWWYFQPETVRAVRSVDPAGALVDAFDPARIIGAVVYVGCALDSVSGDLTSNGRERLVLGSIADAHAKTEALLAALFEGCAITIQPTREIRREVWSKVALNLASNPLSVVANATVGEQFTSPHLARITIPMLEECIALARALGVEPSLTLDEMVAIGRRMGAYYTSMAQDYARGAELEMGAIAHSALELAAEEGVAMDTTRTVADICGFLSERELART